MYKRPLIGKGLVWSVPMCANPVSIQFWWLALIDVRKGYSVDQYRMVGQCGIGSRGFAMDWWIGLGSGDWHGNGWLVKDWHLVTGWLSVCVLTTDLSRTFYLNRLVMDQYQIGARLASDGNWLTDWIGAGFAWIVTGLTHYWYRIGMELMSDRHRLAAWNWHQIGTGLAPPDWHQIGMSWHLIGIGLVLDWRWNVGSDLDGICIVFWWIGFRLASDWHWIGTCMHQIGVKVASYRHCIGVELTSDRERLGIDWQLIDVGLILYWHWIDNGLATDWHLMVDGLAVSDSSSVETLR